MALRGPHFGRAGNARMVSMGILESVPMRA